MEKGRPGETAGHRHGNTANNNQISGGEGFASETATLIFQGKLPDFVASSNIPAE
jgi:hypothetical protein